VVYCLPNLSLKHMSLIIQLCLICIGDIGYSVRRYSEDSPIFTMSSNGTFVWKKDIVLEDVGNITNIVRISDKIDTQTMNAESIADASLVFVAAAYKNGIKFEDPEWITDMFTFNLERAYDDHLEGGDGNDVLIGQRGNDFLSTGKGNDLAIGDAGTNEISTSMEFSRIYQIYRAYETPSDSGYAPESTDGFGFVFTSEFELYSNPYRSLDAQGLSIIDRLVTIDDVSNSSNVVRDIFGISSIANVEGFRMQPMFTVSPGFVTETNILNGDDTIQSDEGDDYLM